VRKVGAPFAGAVIINADALQLYRDLRILTARPSTADEAQCPHKLYGVVDGAVRGTVADWLKLVTAEITAAHNANLLPVLVGGSGMYINTLMRGLAEVPEIDAAVRQATMAHHAALGGEAFRAELVQMDPHSAKLFAGDTQRLIRAYEVVKGTGRTLYDWQHDKSAWQPPAAWRFVGFVLTPEKEALYDICNRRFGLMLQQGALDEVKTLLARNLHPDLPLMKAVGVPELAALLRGELDEATAIAAAKQATRNYAKRQLTWFRHHLPDAMRVSPVTAETAGQMIIALQAACSARM